MRAATPALVRPLWRSRLSWPLRVWMIDSMIWRRGRRNLAPGPWGLGSGGGAQHGDADVVEVGFERCRAVAVVGDEGLARSGDAGRVDPCLRRLRARRLSRRRERTRSAVPRVWRQGAAAGPRSTANATRSIRIGPIPRGQSAFGSRGCVRTRPAWSPPATRRRATTRTRCEASHDTCDHRGAAPQPLVVAVAVGQIREPRPKMRMGVAHELRLVVIAQQRRDHRQGDQLRVRQLRGEPHRRPLRRPPRVLCQQVIDPHIQCGREGVQVRAHAENLQDRSVNTHPELGHPHPTTGGPHPLELII